MRGKDICEALKGIRKDIARSNNISYEPHECHHEGECNGSCPLCDQEAAMILSELRRREKEGYPIQIDTYSMTALEQMAGERDIPEDDSKTLLGDIVIYEPGPCLPPDPPLMGVIATPLQQEDSEPEPDPDIIWDLTEDTPPIVTNPDRVIANEEL